MKRKKKLKLSEEESGQIDVRKLFSIALRQWYLFFIGILVCVGIAFFYLRYTTPLYYVNSTLLIKDDKKGPDLKGNAVFSELELFKATNNIDNEIQVLKSKTLMQRVLSELALQTSYYVEGHFRDNEIYGKELPIRVVTDELGSASYNFSIAVHLKDNDRFDLEEVDENDSIRISTYQFGQKIQKPYGDFTIVKGENYQLNPVSTNRKIIVQFHNVHKLAAYYNSMLYIEPVSKNSSVLNIGITDPVPQKARDIINKLIEVYNKEGIEDKNFIAANTITFLDERLQYITEELTNVEKDVEKYKRQKEITDVSSQAQSYVENASDYKRQLTEWSIQIEMLESVEDYIQQQGDNYELVPGALGIKDPMLTGLVGKFNEMQLERERMLRTMHPGNPLVQNIDAQLSNLRVNILENLRNIKNGLIITRSSLQASSGQFTSKIQEVPSIERHLLEINRQQGIKQGLYLYLLQKREESALALAATVSNIRIIDPAIGGSTPTSPNQNIVFLLAIIMGVSLPLGYIYIKDVLNDKVQERKDIQQITATPILGEISHNQTKDVVVVDEKSRMPVAELFRLIRTNLNFSTLGKENKVIMVTSSMSGEGKTFFTINLAASLALTGKKVVILDLDLRKPSISKDLNHLNDIGVTDYITSPDVSLDEIVKPVKFNSHLFIIGTGPIPPNPAEFIMSPKVGKLINELKINFDYILIDTSPIGQVADAFVLAPLIDTSIYIVRHNYTFKEQLGIIDEIYTEKKLRNPFIVINDAKKEKGYGYGYGYGKNGNKSVSDKKKETVTNISLFKKIIPS